MKTKFLSAFNMILTAIIAALGFSCKQHLLEYGSPYVVLNVSGEVSDIQNYPIEGISVQLKKESKNVEHSEHFPYSQIVYTDSNGLYRIETDGGAMLSSGSDSIWVVVSDPGEVYQADSVLTPVEIDRSKGSGWKWGEADIVADFQLKKQD